ncbi:hypothetical protein K438DRAFT_1774572 [Mycena galopus ATCC 62051]|nr:hypothetical protein K438DRAFT_1774572 [Mycena galopus ATCC 62051]
MAPVLQGLLSRCLVTGHRDHRTEHLVKVVTSDRGFQSMFLSFFVPNREFFAPALPENFLKRQFKLFANEQLWSQVTTGEHLVEIVHTNSNSSQILVTADSHIYLVQVEEISRAPGGREMGMPEINAKWTRQTRGAAWPYANPEESGGEGH